jgi:hypothetical protein
VVASLCLLENFRGKDGRPIDMWPFSTHSCLMSLVYYAREQVNESVLAKYIPDAPHEFAAEIAAKKTPSLAQYHNVSNLVYEFSTDTERLLQRLECLPSRPRTVNVLYRVQEYGYEGGRSHEPFSVTGYAVCIADAGMPRVDA